MKRTETKYRSGNSFPYQVSQILEYIIEIQRRYFPYTYDLYLAIISAAFVNIPSKWSIELCFR